MAYLIDSSAFIQAKNHFYRFSFCPGFWDWVAAHHNEGKLLSVTKVAEELAEGHDELAEWVNSAPSGFFVPPTPQVVTTQGVVSRWVQAQANYTDPEKARFLDRADPWLISEAIENRHEIITFEHLVPANSSKIKIPNVAMNFGVNCANLYDVLEASGAKLRV